MIKRWWISQNIDAGQEDNMAMTTVLQNTFNVYFYLYQDRSVLGEETKDFEDLCIQLSNELLSYCFNWKNDLSGEMA